jgi:hypothetical protein
MPFLYPTISELSSSLNSGSYLNKTDYNLFYKNTQTDLWYGLSNKDAIEFVVYNLQEDLLYWNSVEDLGEFKQNSLTYWDAKNNSIEYLYDQFVFDYPLFKNDKILVSPVSHFSQSNLPDGEYILSYQFTRYLSGTPSQPLVIKEISPNKTEVKLIPSKGRTVEYDAFCLGKFPLYDVSPLYLKLMKGCSYDEIYKNTKVKYQTEVNQLKSIFFLESDGKFVEFLKSIYEDFIKYSNQFEDKVESFVRIQGIRTYFNNFLISNLNNIFSFDDIKIQFEKFVNDRLNILFANFKSGQYKSARMYLFNLFVAEHFDQIHLLLKSSYDQKYNGPLKNALCYSNGSYIPILNTSFIDERVSSDDPLTLLVKLQSPLNDDVSIKSSVWVSNIGMIPILFNVIIKSTKSGKTISISSPDFTVIPKNVSLSNTNISYTSDDLKNESLNEDLVNLNKKINELNIDYSSFDNFVIFSSSELRHNIFKNKMISVSGISASLSSLEASYSSSGYSYPYYTTERTSLQDQHSDILTSFDGFESYLYKTGYYTYNAVSRAFSSSSFVSQMDEDSKTYDKYNRDSLVNNTPEYIISDAQNDDYLIFLSMVGHYFDNIFAYIKALPSQRAVENDNNFSRNILQYMLQSFGWKIDASLESLNISDNYLDVSSAGSSDISADNRTRQIWNRILNTLPLIYKTKGTEECIKLILSCYGVPSTLISIREYGGNDYSNGVKTSYTIEEKLFMLTFKGRREYISVPFYPTNRTIEFKVSLDENREYVPFERIPLVVKYDNSNNLNWSMGVYKEREKHLGRAYFTIDDEEILSDSIPIFNGEIFNVMIRRNEPDPLFEWNSNVDLVPTKYDLWVQKNEDSRTIYSSSKFSYLTKDYNLTFGSTGTVYFGNYISSGSFTGILDKILVWDDPIVDSTFIDHTNNISSYSFTGSSTPHETLFFRMNFDYPEDVSRTNPYIIQNANQYYSSSYYGTAYNFGLGSFSASIDNCVTVSHSYHPYQFREIPYNQTFTITSYGPNKFKNQKIKKVEMEVAARLDPIARSTDSPNKFISPDSNQIGLFADPNDYKNKDIFRYLGDYGITSLIASPSEMYEQKYATLRNIREVYNSSGNKKVLYNELFTLYKFYFDKSIFETIKQLIPSRNTVLTGILIEPTVLERPKYQYKRIGAEACSMEHTASIPSNLTTSSINFRPPTLCMNNSIYSAGVVSGEVVSADFKAYRSIYSSPTFEHIPFYLPNGPYPPSHPLYQRYLELRSRLTFVSSGWVKIFPDSGELKQVEQHSDWNIPSPSFSSVGFSLPESPLGTIGQFGTLPLSDGYFESGSYYYLKNCFFYIQSTEKIVATDVSDTSLNTFLNFSNAKAPTIIYPDLTSNGIICDIENPEELGVHCDLTGKIIESVPSGSEARYLIKKWNRDTTYVNVGEYKKPQPVSSQSLFLYTTDVWSEKYYKDYVYTSPTDVNMSFSQIDKIAPNVPDYSPIATISANQWTFHHDVGTFKKHPNVTRNDIFARFYRFSPGTKDEFTFREDSYFETIYGYPRNHLTHKRLFFSKESKPFLSSFDTQTSSPDIFIYNRYIKSRQSIDTTVDSSGLEDNSLPVQTINVSNINVVKTENVLQ